MGMNKATPSSRLHVTTALAIMNEDMPYGVTACGFFLLQTNITMVHENRKPH